MKIRDSIFDSNAERKLYLSLKSRWEPKFSIYPQVPLSKIISIESKELATMHQQYFPSLQRGYYYQAHPDYTLCDRQGHPLMSLEFDGMTGGFSRYGSYLSNELNTERANKFNFKLKLASLVGYPLVIVSYPEVMPVYPEDDLLVLDGIIGSYIACREFHGRIQQVVNESSKVIEKLDETEVHEYVQDLVWGTEIETELEHNPIARGAAEYEQACRENGIKYYSLSYFAEPSLPEIKDMFDVKGLQARVEAMEYLVGIGCCIKIKTPTNPIEEKVVVRNFGGMGILPLTIAENIAKYRGFKRAYLLYAQNQ